MRRAGLEKLGVKVEPLDAIGREDTMTDWSAVITAGEPKLPQSGHAGTQYTDLRWAEPADLLPAARAGSLCCRVLLRERDLDWER